jgi:flagellar biosynthesis protein FlhF
MKIRRYLGTDMRDALRQIRAELGNDAVILSTRPVGSGVEVSAAVDAQQLQASAMQPQAVAVAQPAAAAPAQAAAPLREQQAMSEELRTLRQLLERQLAALAWNDFTRREPLRARALAELAELGLARDVALALVPELPAEAAVGVHDAAHLELLTSKLKTSESPLARGGALAVIGAAGAGRTTVTAKLALRWVLEHGADSLAIVTIDDEHIGAAAQAQALGRLLGVPSYCFADAAACAAAVDRISGYDCLLIDTPALGSDATANADFMQALRSAVPQLQCLLALPATTQADVLAETLRRSQACAPQSCVLTHYDEALNLGAALSALIRAQLPLALRGDGSELTDELRPARAAQVIARAAELARQSANTADAELLARRYGGEINAAA